MISGYLKSLYERTMTLAYDRAHFEIVDALRNGGACLDCGASEGGKYTLLTERLAGCELDYKGIEWNSDLVIKAQGHGLSVKQGDLNLPIEYDDNTFDCVFGLSVLEHLLYPCRYMNECKRVLKPGGKIVLLTPNISTFFTAALILIGKMPSSGPHPDSDLLLNDEEIIKVSREDFVTDADNDNPSHRHLVVFSYRVLKNYLGIIGFSQIHGHGFGHYPFPKIVQPVFEKIDPWHCHQMVFSARK